MVAHPSTNLVSAPPELAFEGARILVVEDEHLVALDIQQSVKRMGHVVSVVYSGEAAVAQVNRTHFDLVLMDIKLEGKLDGIQAAGDIRASYDVPIIYLTAYADNRTLERARVTEPYGYVLKPFQERELKAAIGMALQRHGTDRHRSEQERVQRFLADASVRLAASLDYRAVASGAAELLVPARADWCMLQLKETDDSVPAFTHARPDGDGNRVPREMLQLVLDTGHAQLRSQIENGDRADARSAICVPLRAREHVVGALALVGERTRRRFGPADLFWAEDFCHRLGMALDNALLYRKAENAIQMRDDVLAIVSHDLRTPLGTVMMQAELLSGDPEHADVGQRIARAAQRMSRLIGDLLDASAINAGKLALDRSIHRIDDILGEAVDMFRSQAESQGIELSQSASAPLANVFCDSDRIVQVLSNLIANALKFTPRSGRVDVSATRRSAKLEIAVQDTGRGIAEEQLPHLFDRFWRAKAHRHGAGLGLFIARGIVASHGGSLAVDSAVGTGSRFFFSLQEARA